MSLIAKIGASVVAAVIIGGIIVTFVGGKYVGPSELGIVKYLDGNVETIQGGWKWVGFGAAVDVLPLGKQSVILSNNPNEGNKEDQSWKIGTKDGQELVVNTNFVWQIDPAKGKELYTAMGGKDVDTITSMIVEPQMKNIVNLVTHDYNWSDIKGEKQAEAVGKINAKLKEVLSADGLLIQDGAFGFSHINAPTGMEEAQKQLASSELAKQKADQDLLTAQTLNKTKIANAEADAQVAIKNAEGQKAQAQAITEIMVQKAFADKWDGKLPQIQAGGSSILNIPQLQQGQATPAK